MHLRLPSAAWLPWLTLALSGCGPEPGDLGEVAAALYVPRDLIDDLNAVEVYVYETDYTTKAPSCDPFLANPTYYTSLKEQKMVTILMAQGGSQVIDGIPDRRNVWRFYARGLDDIGVAIADGCAGVVDVEPDGEPVAIDIHLASY